MKTIILLSYNNYYNRIVKRPLQSAAEYVLDGATVIHQTPNVNFYENDGVSTSLVVDYIGSTHPDYILVADDDGNVVQRWYVIDSTHQSGTQRRLSLLRDVIADHFFAISNSPMFVEKAMLSVSDPAIFNDEGISVNQILTSKELLSDQTGCPWIVGYIPKNYPEQSQTLQFNYTPIPDLTVTRIEDWEYYLDLQKDYWAEDQTLYAEANYSWPGASDNYKAGITLAISNIGTIEAIPATNASNWEYFRFESPIYIGKIEGEADGVSSVNPRNFKDYVAEQIASLNPTTCYNYAKAFIGVPNIDPALEALVGKIVLDSSTNTSYRVVRTRKSVYYSKKYTSLSGPLWQALNPVFNARPDNFMNLSTTFFHLIGHYNVIKYELSTLGAEGQVIFTNNRSHLIDQPYDMFVMPYSDDLYLGLDNTAAFKFSKELAMGFAQQLAAKIGSSAVFDVQILPYCPIINLYYVDEYGHRMINFKEVAATAITTIPDEGGSSTQIGALFWCSSSQFSFEIPYYIDLPRSSIERKLISVCDKYRLCSPNMASFFDFDPIKNNGVSSIEVDCYYKPFNPYIHLNPRFGGIYGGKTGYEVRGIDLGGNFSLTQISDAWTDYQLQNKNFENIFNRQMDSLEMQHGVQDRFDILNAFTGTVSGAASGGMTGAAAGPWGAVAGAVVGGVASGIGGAMDINVKRMLRQEQVSLQEDVFAYQKGNIQALPNSLTKVDTLSPNNPLIPYIEFYTCTSIEREAVRNILRYSGMTVGRVGTISDFLASTPQYIRGRLIRTTGIAEDFHIVQQISQELQKGVYI